MTEDITERKRAEQRLREAQKMEVVGRLVGGVAHDFNNLLTGIMRYSDLLVAGLAKDGRLRRHAEETRLAGEQGAALIQQLLAISRQQVIEPRILCLNQTVTGTRNLLGRLIGENIELRLQVGDLPPAVSNQQASTSAGNGDGASKIVPMSELEKQTILTTIAQLKGDKLPGGTFAGHRKDYVVSETEGIQFPRLNRVLR